MDLIRYAGDDRHLDGRRLAWRGARRLQRKAPARRAVWCGRHDLDMPMLRALDAEGVRRVDIAALYGVTPTCVTQRLGVRRAPRPRKDPAWWAAIDGLLARHTRAEAARRLGVCQSALNYALKHIRKI